MRKQRNDFSQGSTRQRPFKHMTLALWPLVLRPWNPISAVGSESHSEGNIALIFLVSFHLVPFAIILFTLCCTKIQKSNNLKKTKHSIENGTFNSEYSKTEKILGAIFRGDILDTFHSCGKNIPGLSMFCGERSSKSFERQQLSVWNNNKFNSCVGFWEILANVTLRLMSHKIPHWADECKKSL